jgi:hypothetical protein
VLWQHIHVDIVLLLLLPLLLLLLLQLAAAGAIPHIFSLCFGFPTGGALLLGEHNTVFQTI